MATTPEFVRWNLGFCCSLRQFDDPADSEQVERYLKPLRAYCEAVEDGRLFEGVCVAVTEGDDVPEKGFRAEEILSAYGGLGQLESLCGPCPANAMKSAHDPALAGCYGMFEISGIESQLFETIENCLGRNNWQAEYDEAFLQTRPRWHGLWADTPLSPHQCGLLGQLLTAVVEESSQFANRFADIRAALDATINTDLPLHVAMSPSGRVEREKWIVAAHCPRCRATWKRPAKACAVCGQKGPPIAERKRNVRGDRPYWRLPGFMGEQNLSAFLKRYHEHRRAK